MFHSTSNLGAAGRRAMIGVAVGVAVWLGLLLHGASMSRQNTAGRGVRFGPLVLHTISMEQDGPTVRAAITVEPGLAWYTSLWAIAGIGAGWIRPHTKYTRG